MARVNENENQGRQEQDVPVLVLDKVTKDFGGLRAVNGVSMEVMRGERRAVIGPNGAGKTTLFNLITGELPMTSGRVILSGRNISSLSAHRRIGAGLGRTYQITNIFLGLTVEENVQLAAQGLSPIKFSLHRPIPDSGPIHDKVVRVLEDLELTRVKDTVTSELSYGEQRQLEIALALVGEPEVLLLDEPAAGLSAAERVSIATLIRSLPTDLTIILIEHDMDLALGLVDRVTCLHFGSVIAEDIPDNIRENEQIQEIYLGAA